MRIAESLLANRLILNALRLTDKGIDYRCATEMGNEDWRSFLHMTTMHRLAPLVHDNLSRSALLHILPAPVHKSLEAARQQSTFRNLSLYRELVNVTRILDSAGVPSIALKGAYLARYAYPSAGLRPMRDLDILIARNQAISSFDALRTAGYAPKHAGLPSAYLDGNKIHLPPLLSPDGILIELHHRLTAPDTSRPKAEIFEKDLWNRCISKTIGTTNINFPCPEDLLIHLCHHASFGHQLSIGPLALTDIARLLETTRVDWDEFLRLAKECKWQRSSLVVLFLAKKHLAADIPEQVLDALQTDKDEASWVESAEYLLLSDLNDHILLNDNMQAMLNSSSLMTRLSSLIQALFPSRQALAAHFPVDMGSSRLLLYYPQNWLRLLRKKIPGLISSLIRHPHEVRRLADHKARLKKWLYAEPD